MDNDKKSGSLWNGRIWTESDSKVLFSGNIVKTDTKDSDTPDKRYVKVIRSTNDKGETKTEFCVSLGLLYPNKDKRSQNSPDIGGPLTLDQVKLKLGAWLQETEGSGDEYSLSLSEPYSQQENNEEEDKYPF